MRWLAYTLISALFPLAACRNAPAAEREHMRREVETVKPEDVAALRAKRRVTLVGDAVRPADVDPHLRASAAQDLGNLGDPADYEVLVDALAGVLADENAQVRMECAVALGKLRYEGARDERCATVIKRLRDRAEFDRDESGRPAEREYLVRLSLVNSLIQIGGRKSAAAIYDIAVRLIEDLDHPDGAVRADIADKGLLDRSLEGLRVLTKATREEAEANRRQSDDFAPHMQWWAVRIYQMSEG